MSDGPAWQHLARERKVEDAIVAYLVATGPATFHALARAFAPFVPVEGSLAWELHIPNVFVWAGMGTVWLHTLMRLHADRRVFFHEAQRADYERDGMTLPWPIPELVPDAGFAAPRWLPVLIASYAAGDPTAGIIRAA